MRVAAQERLVSVIAVYRQVLVGEPEVAACIKQADSSTDCEARIK